MIAEGTPEHVAENPRSYTGGYLKPLLAKGQRPTNNLRAQLRRLLTVNFSPVYLNRILQNDIVY